MTKKNRLPKPSRDEMKEIRMFLDAATIAVIQRRYPAPISVTAAAQAIIAEWCLKQVGGVQ